MQENHLAKWLNNELTEAEITAFKKSDGYATYQRIVSASSELKGPEFDSEEALKALKNTNTLHSKKVVQLQPFKKFIRVAAAIAILLTASYFYLNSLDEAIQTEYAENRTLILPDASEITLNADSELTYQKKNWDSHRNINLKGEAFFKVAKGKRFTVTTTDGIVTVLGTQFNVENREGIFEVSCYEGLVSVTFKGKELKLPAGSSFMAINGQIVVPEKTNSSKPSWMNAESSFKSMPLQYVFDEFERQHNVNVTTKNIDTNQLYTGTFSNTDINLAISSITAPLQIKFKFEGNKVLFYAKNQ